MSGVFDEWRATEYEDEELIATLMNLARQQMQPQFICVAFSGFACESLIYEYAIHHFSRKYVNKYLDKISLDAKWAVIPRLAGMQEIDRESQAFARLRELLTLRNDIAHSKSRTVDRMDMKKAAEHFVGFFDKWKNIIPGIEQTFDLLLAELRRDPGNHPFLESVDKYLAMLGDEA